MQRLGSARIWSCLNNERWQDRPKLRGWVEIACYRGIKTKYLNTSWKRAYPCEVREGEVWSRYLHEPWKVDINFLLITNGLSASALFRAGVWQPERQLHVLEPLVRYSTPCSVVGLPPPEYLPYVLVQVRKRKKENSRQSFIRVQQLRVPCLFFPNSDPDSATPDPVSIRGRPIASVLNSALLYFLFVPFEASSKFC